ncbi:lycopene cyclase domain-containing protein [Adhaeribacter sp. BT258]|uniref:Lycopene cyclase domain-containing protein n=1 Tax=Adhaeribacter terrigena TaxID=2793070 RepID=A0ABS1BYE8_9BACT|nr:lycopene cyclase domain-containing protein [Adhaeribacter terrigena]MBK0402190.1 lycopene cyclase domain-containing protein [Adhaeribacter terrigena]
MYIYLYLNLFTIFFPLALSFDKRVAFYKTWPALFPAIFVNAAVFIPWDIYFTQRGIWGFNPEYLLGINIFGLPLEEVMFFFTVPYACLFIYQCLNVYFGESIFQKHARVFTFVLIAFLAILAAVNLPRLYTSATAVFLIVMFVLHFKLFGFALLGKFYRAYLVHLIPFLLVNGVLTAIPIVWYNNDFNLGLRVYTIPIEDSYYSMLLLLLPVTVFELIRAKRKHLAVNTV